MLGSVDRKLTYFFFGFSRNTCIYFFAYQNLLLRNLSWNYLWLAPFQHVQNYVCVTPPFSINFRNQIENLVNDYRLLGASSLMISLKFKSLLLGKWKSSSTYDNLQREPNIWQIILLYLGKLTTESVNFMYLDLMSEYWGKQTRKINAIKFPTSEDVTLTISVPHFWVAIIGFNFTCILYFQLNQFKKKTGKTSPANPKKSKTSEENSNNPESDVKNTTENTFHAVNGEPKTDIIQVCWDLSRNIES